MVYPVPGRRSQARIVAGRLNLPAMLGRSGTTWMKREGDGATPNGRYRMRSLVIRPDRILGRSLREGVFPTRIMRADDGWCEAPYSGRYNQPVRVAGSIAGQSDRMWRQDRLYDVVGVLDWNICPRVSNRGSAIFLHLTRLSQAPTAGCIALDPSDFMKLMAQIGPKTMFFTGLRPGKGRYRR